MTTPNKTMRSFPLGLLLIVQLVFGATLAHASTQEMHLRLPAFGNKDAIRNVWHPLLRAIWQCAHSMGPAAVKGSCPVNISQKVTPRE